MVVEVTRMLEAIGMGEPLSGGSGTEIRRPFPGISGEERRNLFHFLIPMNGLSGERAVRGEHQAHGGRTAGERLLRQRATGVAHGLELTEGDAVRLLQTELAERPLRALRRSGQRRRLSGALRR